MKVLIVTSVLPIVGGVATWVNLLARKLNDYGYGTKIINTGSISNDFTFFPSRIIKLIKYLLNFDCLFWLFYITAKYIIKLTSLFVLNKSQYDIIHAQDINSSNALSVLCKKRGIKLILTVHGHFYHGGTSTRTFREDSRLCQYLISEEIYAFKKADHIITVSDDSYRFVCEIVDRHKVSLIHNFVDTNKYYPCTDFEKIELRSLLNYDNDNFVILYVGQIIKRKGLIHLLEGIMNIKDELPLKLIITGDGKEKINLSNFIRMNKLDKIICFTGELSGIELLKMYQVSDVFVMTSVSDEGSIEGTPMAILEAMACGLPVIASKVGGIPGVVKHMETGILINEKDGKAVAEALKLLYHNRSLYLLMKDNALKEINNSLSLDHVMNKVLDIYNN